MSRIFRIIDDFADDEEQGALIVRFLAPYRQEERDRLLIDLVNRTLPRLDAIAALDVGRVVEIRRRLHEAGASAKTAHVEAVLITAGIRTQ